MICFRRALAAVEDGLLRAGVRQGGRCPVRGEHGLSTVTCPEGKEAYIPPGSGILTATFRGWKRGDRAPQMLQDVLEAEHGGHKLPLESVRLVLKLPLELSLAGRPQEFPKVSTFPPPQAL